MATYDIAAIRTAIYNILAAVPSLEVVYKSPNPTIAGYPAAIFDLDNEDGSILDDTNNQRILTFKIWIACETGVEGVALTADLLDSVTKDVVNALEKQSNMALGGAADWTLPTIGQRQQINSTDGNYLYQELNLKVYVASSIM